MMPARNLPPLRLKGASLRGALLGLASLTVLAGCTMAPKYQRPAAPVPQAWPQGAAYPAPQPAATPAADLAWKAFFVDPKLQQVIDLALANNRDLRVAVLNIAEAHAQYRVQRSALFPNIDAAGNGTNEYLPAKVLGVQSGASGASAANRSITIKYYSATLGVSNYELDLWGRVRSLSKQAREEYLATKEARRAEQISLISQVATAYVTYAADLKRLNLSQDTVKSDENTLSITNSRFQSGIASELDVRQAESALEQAKAGVATYTTAVAQDVNALTLLVGAPVPTELLPAPLENDLPTVADLPAGLSSDVLLRRPDVMEAEDELKGYNANIGAARAAFFPTIELTGSGGSTALSMSDLFGAGSGAWTFTPAITLPIFDAGKNAANLRYAKAQRDVAVAQYEKSVQTAFREVADALAQRGQIADLVSANEREADAFGHSLNLSQARYERGSDTFLNVLTAQVNTYSAQQNLISARLTRATNLITLYQTLGGGVN
jgi:multidrug efflux system outer membrane protein